MRTMAAPFSYATESNASSISAGVSTGVRIARVVASESPSIATSVSAASSTDVFHSGLRVASGRFSIQVANPSLSQRSSHQRIVTRLPNH